MSTTYGPAERPARPNPGMLVRKGYGLDTVQFTRDGHTVYVLPLPGHKPPRGLSPNGAHGHWSAPAKARRVLKAATVTRVRQARIPLDQEHVHVSLHYVPKERRKRDADNLVPILKPCLDALTARRGGAGVIPDDTPEYVTWAPPVIHDPDVYGPRLYLEVTLCPRENVQRTNMQASPSRESQS